MTAQALRWTCWTGMPRNAPPPNAPWTACAPGLVRMRSSRGAACDEPGSGHGGQRAHWRVFAAKSGPVWPFMLFGNTARMRPMAASFGRLYAGLCQIAVRSMRFCACRAGHLARGLAHTTDLALAALSAARRLGAGRVLLASSSAVYGNKPRSP